MKIGELSIGDWVKVDIYPTPRRVMRVNMEWSDDGGSVYLMGVARKFGISVIDPIPLTPKILEKNGFVCKDGYRFVNIDMLSTVEKYGNKYYDYHNIYKKGKTYRPIRVEVDNIRYVHELQHAMKLAGIEKEIEV